MIRRLAILALLGAGYIYLAPVGLAAEKPKADGLFLSTSLAYYSGPVMGVGLGWQFKNGYCLSGSYQYGQLKAVHGTVSPEDHDHDFVYSVPVTVDDRGQSGFGIVFTVPLKALKAAK